MAVRNVSIPTSASVEFVNLSPLDVSPTIAKAECKVFYLGGNRNGSYIDKPTALQMAKTLRGCPIVGEWLKHEEDYGGHGEEMIINDQGVEFRCKTTPLGFVPTDAQVWFKTFYEEDAYGNSVERDYLMTNVYIWRDQFPESEIILSESEGQSMELGNVEGDWKTTSEGRFYVITQASIDKLCVLGSNVEPCFEGASITAPQVSKTFQVNDDTFSTAFARMTKEFSLIAKDIAGEEKTFSNTEEATDHLVDETKKGEFSMSEQNTSTTEEFELEAETPAVEEPVEVEESEDGASANVETSENFSNENLGEISESIEDKNDIEVENEFSESVEETNVEEVEETTEEVLEEPVAEEPTLEQNYNQLQTEFSALQEKYNSLEEEVVGLRQFKLTIEDKQKDDLIASFYMLSDEDKKEIVDNKSKYSLDEIESKLAVICFRKKVDFNLAEEVKEESHNEAPMLFNLDNHDQVDIPAWLQSVDAIHEERKTI